MKDKLKIRPRAFDESWKKMIEGYFWEFLDFYFPDIFAQLDQSSGYTFLDKELEKIARTAPSKKRRVDKLAKVYIKGKR